MSDHINDEIEEAHQALAAHPDAKDVSNDQR